MLIVCFEPGKVHHGRNGIIRKSNATPMGLHLRITHWKLYLVTVGTNMNQLHVFLMFVSFLLQWISVKAICFCGQALFKLAARRKERLWRRVSRRCLSNSQQESCGKSLPATIEFLLYLPGIFFSIWPLKYATLSLESKEVHLSISGCRIRPSKHQPLLSFCHEGLHDQWFKNRNVLVWHLIESITKTSIYLVLGG